MNLSNDASAIAVSLDASTILFKYIVPAIESYTSTATQGVNTYTFNNSTAYKHYILHVTKVMSGNYLHIAGMVYYETVFIQGIAYTYELSANGDWLLDGGSANSWARGATHVFNGSLTDGADGEHTASNLFSGGNIIGNNIFHIMFVFPTSTTITKYKIWGRNSSTHAYNPKSWELRGAASSSAYNNGSGTYTVLDTQTDVADIGYSYSNSITNDNQRGEYNVPLANQGSYTTNR